MSEDLKRIHLCRQKLEDIRASLEDVQNILCPPGERLLMFESMMLGRTEATLNAVQGSIERLRQYEEMQTRKKLTAPPSDSNKE